MRNRLEQARHRLTSEHGEPGIIAAIALTMIVLFTIAIVGTFNDIRQSRYELDTQWRTYVAEAGQRTTGDSAGEQGIDVAAANTYLTTQAGPMVIGGIVASPWPIPVFSNPAVTTWCVATDAAGRCQSITARLETDYRGPLFRVPGLNSRWAAQTTVELGGGVIE